ncbi:hypothetical protein ACFQZI_02805 [Mucilaginibacter lutimaris]|uniref:Uncharacterized protein n=1 Tax=Mucilaginibacter lutimaris TaxID=931629 RepID=A0ABW2ZAP0_9SPHI
MKIKNMDMQDKEIDSLFRSKLDNFEIEPSAHVWNGIETQMANKKRPLGLYLSIAASLLILLSAGLYFVSNTNDVAKKPVQIVAAKNNKPAKTIVLPVIVVPNVTEPQLRKVIALNTVVSRKQKVKVAQKPVTIIKQEEIIQPVQQLAQVVQKTDVQVQYVVPDKSVPFNEKIATPEQEPISANAQVIQPQGEVAKTLAAAPVKKRRIRNFGDLINAVVSKVDKRKDKLIEFSTPKDEDDSTLSGLNLGFIKIKKTDQ